ncbi:MAG: hypothetical protein NT175_05925 [Bacteroidetes bacterium]|nr:hypothetical protein [Bacteroidota bacterium]
MKKILSAILLIAIVYDTCGYYLCFRMMQQEVRKEIRKEIRSRISKEDLTRICIPVNNKTAIRWIKENKEFVYNQDLYDIVSIEVKNDAIVYYCINDIKEKQLIRDFEKLSKNKVNAPRSKTQLNLNFLLVFFFQSSENSLYDVPKEFRFPDLFHFYTSAIKDILSPPPEYSILT